MIIYPWNQNKCYRTKKEKEMEVKQRNREAKKKKDKWNEEKKGLSYLTGNWAYEIDGFLHIPCHKELLCMFVFH